MTFAQRRNHLTTHFSERIPVVKRRISVFTNTDCKQKPGDSVGIVKLEVRSSGNYNYPSARPDLRIRIRHTDCYQQNNCWLTFRLTAGYDIFLCLPATSRPALRPNQPPSPWVPATSFLGTEQHGRQVDHSPQFSAGYEYVEQYLHSPYTWISFRTILRVHLINSLK